MATNVSSELKNLGVFLKGWHREIIVISFATLFIILHNHHKIENFWISSIIYFGLLPILTILIFLRKKPA
jgi:hypothetical protein